MNTSSSDSEEEVEPINARTEQEPPDYSFVLGLQGVSMDVSQLRPSKETRLRLWDIFRSNVEPMTKIFHFPSIESELLNALEGNCQVPPKLELLCFCIYLGAVTSLSDPECQSLLLEERSVLCSKYRRGIESLLSSCRLTSTDDLQVLQAFVLYLVLLKNHNADLSWRLTGLATRLGYSLGLHREGNFGLTVFDTEMRRRLWWHITILEAPASEDYSSESTSLSTILRFLSHRLTIAGLKSAVSMYICRRILMTRMYILE